MSIQKKDSLFKNWLPTGKKGGAQLERLKVFLDSAPGEYFGWSDKSDTLLYSPGFARLFGEDALSSHEGIQNSLEPFDAASFEATLKNYQKDPCPKELIVQTYNGRYLELSFRWGESDSLHYHVIWARDITDVHKAHQQIQKETEENNKGVKRLQHILDALPQPIWIRDSTGRITWCNSAYGESFGKTTTEIIEEQKNISIKPKGASKKVTSEAIAAKALKTGQLQTLDGYGIVKGERLSIQIQEKPYANLDITVGLAENLTWKEEIESKNKRNMSGYHTVLGSLQTAVALYDADQRLEFYNAGFSQLWQLEESWLNQKPKLGDILEKLRETRRLPEQTNFKDYKRGWTDMFTKLIDTHSDMIVLPDGTVLRTQIIPHPMGGLSHVYEDVTSNLELESSYNTLMAVQKETIDNLTEGVVVYGSDGRLKLWNHTFKELWGLNPEDLEGEPHITKIFDRTKDFFEEDFWINRKKFILSALESRVQKRSLLERKDGIIINFSSMPLPDGGMLFTYADVTDSIRVEEALREKNTALETAEQLKTDFLAKISYQLRTPLSALIGFNDILDHEYFGPLNEKQKEYTQGMKDAGQSLKNLIDDILDLTSIEAGIICLETEETEISGLLKTIKDSTQDWADNKQIRIDLKCPKTIGKINIDSKRIKHAITHLIRNAINFTPEKGTIHISAKKQKNQMLIAIQDTGDGIPQEHLNQIFKPFEKSVTTEQKNISGGAGLGLTLVKNIVELHRGSIKVESVEHKGTTVTLSFPL